MASSLRPTLPLLEKQHLRRLVQQRSPIVPPSMNYMREIRPVSLTTQQRGNTCNPLPSYLRALPIKVTYLHTLNAISLCLP
ncbi:hypothetical protein I7I53_06814 [Histoplasma capsulatum var. duboisii H88]|uniref:Uncharacterized protein n=1 Tax=Ajellomyces capsulatus (strain H88) TaxID=544711 RepID=A0A8A1LHM1_AJEC8|nr:hypothetical protein I7I53_06814 [Histoplasma capsulatum var. duboisii H88]